MKAIVYQNTSIQVNKHYLSLINKVISSTCYNSYTVTST